MSRDPETAWSPWTPSASEPWNRQRAAHLMRRAGFGSSPKTLDDLVDAGFDSAIQQLFACGGREEFEAEMQPIERVLTSSQDPQALASWWLLRMARTPCPFLEKMTLFWHGHFATGADKVADARAMLAQNRLLRANALGHYEPMVQGISRDVAMLIWLDSTDNRKTRPNENYARELMELFCLGPGNYREEDIKQLARCFTGWEVRRGAFRINAHQHDEGVKSFLGKSGNFDGQQAVRIVLDHPASAGFLARKLINYLVVDDVPDAGFCQPVADTLRKTDFDLAATIRQILVSRFFWSSQAIGQKVRSPVELAIGMIRGLGVSVNMNELRTKLAALGHLPMFPPNVKGWEGGRRWINASTYIGRVNLVREILEHPNSALTAGSLSRAAGVNANANPREWVGQLTAWLVPVPLTESTIHQLYQIARDSGNNADSRVRNVIGAVAATPEFQLS